LPSHSALRYTSESENGGGIMFGLNITVIDWASWIIAIAVTIYVSSAKNPFEKGTDEYQALRLCRIGLALLVWSFGFGLIGFAFALTSFILGIIGIVKGRTMYGIMLIVGSVCLPIISSILTFSTFMPH
jgi:mannitol-specific phosphotransferase system IIBC component